MGSSVLEIIFLPVLWGVFCGIGMGIVLLAVMSAVERVIDWLARASRLVKLQRQATVVAKSRRRRPAVHIRRHRRVYG
jgi:hypothetical protein